MLRSGKNKGNTIIGSPNYEILSNLTYNDKFQFKQLCLRNSVAENTFSDMITEILYTSPHLHIFEQSYGLLHSNDLEARKIKKTIPKFGSRETLMK